MIAPTSYTNRETEKRTIKTRVSSTQFELTEKLSHKHYAATESYTDHLGVASDIEMRAEVGLLTRNIVFRGEPVSS